jgi:hypothetical protein
VGSTFDNEERGPASGGIFRRISSVLRHAKETSFKHLLAGDWSWFCSEYPYDSAWTPSMAVLPTRKAQKIQIKNAWFSLIGRRLAFTVFLLCLPGCGTMRSFLCIYSA